MDTPSRIVENHPTIMTESTEQYYDSIAQKYDWFYASWDSAGEEQRRQLCPLFQQHNVRRVLDCACGNGLQAIALAQAGYEVTASDLSENMLREAAKKCRDANLDIPLIRADIRELHEKVDASFDAVICMGNVLPHLMSDTEILDALANIRGVLEPGGLLVLEGRYYDELVKTKERFIAHRVAACEEHTFITILYVLDHMKDRIRFNIVFLTKNENGETSLDVDTVDYNPILVGHLRELLLASGFESPEITRHDDRIFCTAIRND
jgi:ubiquinone/menaquinone biosynthesis C-methylase UbiE